MADGVNRFMAQRRLLDRVTNLRTARLEALLAEIQESLFDRALRFRQEHTYEARNYDELKEEIENGLCAPGGPDRVQTKKDPGRNQDDNSRPSSRSAKG